MRHNEFFRVKKLKKRAYNHCTKMWGSFELVGRYTGESYFTGGKKLCYDVMNNKAYFFSTTACWEQAEKTEKFNRENMAKIKHISGIEFDEEKLNRINNAFIEVYLES